MANELDRIQPTALEPRRTRAEHDFTQFNDLVKFLNFLWRRKWLVVLGFLISLGLGAAYCLYRPPVYESTAQVLVMDMRPHGSSRTDGGLYYFEDNVATHVSLIKSPWFVSNVIDGTTLPSLADAEDPIREVINQLSVSRDDGDDGLISSSSILNLSCRGAEPEDCRIILGAVVDRYDELLNELSRNVNEDALKSIAGKAEIALQNLMDKETEYQQFREQASMAWNAETGESWYQTRVAEIESKRLDLLVRRVELQTRLGVLKSTVQQGPVLAALPAVVPESLRNDPDPAGERQLLALLLEEKALSRDLGPGHPDVIALREQIALAREFIQPMSEVRLAMKPGMQSLTESVAPLDLYIRSLEQEIRDAEAAEQLLFEESDKERKQAKQMADYAFRDRRFRDEIARLEKFHDSLIEQLRGVDLNKDLVGYSMRVIAPVEEAVQVAPRPFLVFALTATLGVLVGLVFGGLAEAAGQTPKDPLREACPEARAETRERHSGNGQTKETKTAEEAPIPR
jgi:uncharacterized protein involved in exopolysaccharide biosynthesis